MYIVYMRVYAVVHDVLPVTLSGWWIDSLLFFDRSYWNFCSYKNLILHVIGSAKEAAVH